jgi:hypothetical protein
MANSSNGAYRTIGGQRYLLKPRRYVINVTHDAVANSTAFNNTTVDPYSPFLLTNCTMYDTNDIALTAPGQAGQYENFVQIQDQSNNYNWSNDFEPRSSFARDRPHGFELPIECLIAANTKLQATCKNPAANMAAGISTITLQGYSLYPA